MSAQDEALLGVVRRMSLVGQQFLKRGDAGEGVRSLSREARKVLVTDAVHITAHVMITLVQRRYLTDFAKRERLI